MFKLASTDSAQWRTLQHKRMSGHRQVQESKLLAFSFLFFRRKTQPPLANLAVLHNYWLQLQVLTPSAYLSISIPTKNTGWNHYRPLCSTLSLKSTFTAPTKSFRLWLVKSFDSAVFIHQSFKWSILNVNRVCCKIVLTVLVLFDFN